MKKAAVSILLIGLLCGASTALFAGLPQHPLIDLTREKRGPRLEYALQNNVEIGLTPDGKAFYLWWLPEGSDPENPPPIVATISGHDGWAVEDFHIWHPFLKKRHYGTFAIQWWLGHGERSEDYLTPAEMYTAMEKVFAAKKVKPGSVLLHGFSRGSANTYAVAALDRASHNNYFTLIVANAGKPVSDYPPTREIENGRYGAAPFEGTHWVTFAGGQDPNPDRDGVEGMREAARWIKKYGGVVDLAIEDPAAAHGGFHRNPKNTEAALDVFDQRVNS